MKCCLVGLFVLVGLLFPSTTKTQDNALPLSYYTYDDIERKAFLLSYVSWPHPMKQKCVDSLPYIRYAPAIPVQPCDEITEYATGCYDIETDHPRITIWIGAVASCELHVRLLLHEFMHHWLYCHLDITNHPDVYFGKLLDYQTKNAVKAICVP